MVPRQIAHERNIRMAVGAGSAQNDAIVQADEITSDGVDPEQETALGPGRLDPRQRPGRSGHPMRPERLRRTGCGPTDSCQRRAAQAPGPASRFDPPLSQTIPSAASVATG